MAIPFRQSDNSEQQERNVSKESQNGRTNASPLNNEERTENCCRSQTSNGSAPVVATVHCISNSNILNCGPTVINVINKEQSETHSLSRSSKNKCETDRKIKVRKGIFTSKRIITTHDIQIVAEDVEEDWKKLLKKLPGVTLTNYCFHQSFVDAMDRGDSTNMAEIALCTWKDVLPEFSNIGNLSKALFSIGHPDIVTHLRP